MRAVRRQKAVCFLKSLLPHVLQPTLICSAAMAISACQADERSEPALSCKISTCKSNLPNPSLKIKFLLKDAVCCWGAFGPRAKGVRCVFFQFRRGACLFTELMMQGSKPPDARENCSCSRLDQYGSERECKRCWRRFYVSSASASGKSLKTSHRLASPRQKPEKSGEFPLPAKISADGRLKSCFLLATLSLRLRASQPRSPEP